MLIKPLALVLVLVFLTASCIIVAKPVSGASAVGNTWVDKAPMPTARGGLGVAVVNGKIYAIGGTTASGRLPGTFGTNLLGFRDIGGFVGTTEEYDPTTDNWSTKASMPTPRIGFATAIYQNKIYCMGGKAMVGSQSADFSGVNEVYDPETDTWQTKSPVPFAQSWLTASVVNGKIYLIGGGANADLNEVYDPATDSWTSKALITRTPPGPVSAVYDDKIYNIGSILQIYDSATDKWSWGTQPPSSSGESGGATTGALASRRIYVIGPPDVGPSNMVYDPKSDNWVLGADLPARIYNFAVAVVNDTLFVIGGQTYKSFSGDFAPVASNEQYTPVGYGMPDPAYVLETTPPKISVLSPLNQTYIESNVFLDFTVDKAVNWTSYSLDGGLNQTIVGNSNLSGLSNGLHNITVYSNDTFGNIGVSEKIAFTVAKPESFPTAIVLAVSGVAAVVVCVGILLYVRKRRR